MARQGAGVSSTTSLCFDTSELSLITIFLSINIYLYFRNSRYIGVCCGIKVLSVAIFLIDWWLIRQRQNAEKKQSALTVGEVVNSIISLDKRESIF